MDAHTGGGLPVTSLSTVQGTRTLWLADHLLAGERGHHLSYNGFIADAALRAGLDVRVLCAKSCRARVPEGFRMDGIFRADWRSNPPPWLAGSRRALDFLEFAARTRFRADLRRNLLPSCFHGEDIVFAGTPAPRHLAGWLAWLLDLPAGREPAVVLHVGYAAERFGADLAIPRLLAALQSSGKITRIRFVTDSTGLQGKYQKILDRPVAVLPVVVSRRAADSYKPPQRPPLFSCLGNARREKGFAEVLAAVDAINARNPRPPLRFLLQTSDPDPSASAALAGFRSRHADNVRLIPRPLSDDAYLAALKETDVVLAPYHVNKYQDRTSSLFCEAMTAGKPLIATEGTFMGRDVSRDGTGWLVRDRDADSLAAAFLRAESELEQAAARCREKMPRYALAFHPDTFVSGLLALVDERR